VVEDMDGPQLGILPIDDLECLFGSVYLFDDDFVFLQPKDLGAVCPPVSLLGSPALFLDQLSFGQLPASARIQLIFLGV